MCNAGCWAHRAFTHGQGHTTVCARGRSLFGRMHSVEVHRRTAGSSAALSYAFPITQSRCRCGRGEPSPGADVAGVSPVPVQTWTWGEPSPGAHVAGVPMGLQPDQLAWASSKMRASWGGPVSVDLGGRCALWAHCVRSPSDEPSVPRSGQANADLPLTLSAADKRGAFQPACPSPIFPAALHCH